MATNRSIAAAFAVLRSAGFRPPAELSTVDQVRIAMPIWHDALSDLTDDELTLAVSEYIRQSSAPWWPVPGQLRAMVESQVSGAHPPVVMDRIDREEGE